MLVESKAEPQTDSSYAVSMRMPAAGLCDRLYHLLAGAWMQERLGPKTPLTLDWTERKQCPARFECLFAPLPLLRLQELPTDIVFEIVGRRAHRDATWSGLHEMELLCADLSRSMRHAPYAPTVGFLEDGQHAFYQSISAPPALKFETSWHLYSLLRPVAALQQRIASARDQLGLSGDVIGLHLRGTDKRDVAQRDTSNSDLLFETEAKLQAFIRMNPRQKFFLCTDDRHYKEYLMMRFSENLLTIPIHYAGEKSDGSKSAHGFRSIHNVYDAVVELWLLAETNYNDKWVLPTHSSGFTAFPDFLRRSRGYAAGRSK